MFNSTARGLRFLALCGTAALVVAAQPAVAAQTTGNLSVSATVTANCAVSTSTVAFGNVDVTSGSNVDGTGSISVTCTDGTAWSAAANAGTGTGASINLRKMTSGSELLNYALYTDSGRTTVWGDGVTGATIDGTGNGSAQAQTIYGRVPSGQTSVSAGSYADTVTVTVTY